MRFPRPKGSFGAQLPGERSGAELCLWLIWVCLWQQLPTKAASLTPLTDFSKAAIVPTQATHGHSSDSLVDSGRPQCGLKSSKEPPRGNLQGWRHR